MCPELIEIEQYLSGDMDAASRDSFTAHLSECADCASRLSDVQENLGVVAAVRGVMADRAGRLAETARPEAIGPFQIVGERGRGGMGIVYEARQREPDRLVAVKVLHPTYGLGDHHERLFRREVRALGRLRHPGIAAIHEAGRTPEGRSYFVMELIEGLPLAEYARQNRLSVQERLALFASACEAVAYAHQRGVIHRDLKPSNILVERSGGVKVLDFGLAAILAQDDASDAASLVSEPGRIFGTVPYMSPEHVRGRSADIDVRSDVYSLGVILYQLLTDRLPYHVDPANLPEAAAAICETPPARPAGIRPELRGDVETIVVKALEKDPQHRYQTVAALSDDIRRYLHDEPILARPPSFSYQFRKLIKRHRWPFAFAATVFALVLTGGVVAASLAVRLARERQAAIAARDDEAAARRQAEAVNTFLQDMLAKSDPSVRPGTPDVTLREVLDEAAAEVNEGAFRDHPEVEIPLRVTIGNAYRAIGRYEEAEVQLRAAVDLGAATWPDGHADYAKAMHKLGRLLHEAGNYEEAETIMRRTLAMRKAIFGPQHAEVATAMNNLGMLLESRGELDEAEDLLRSSLAMRIALFGDKHKTVANSLNNLAVILHGKRDLAAAKELYRRSLAMDTELRGPDHPNVAATRSNLALVLEALGRPEDAEPLLQESLASLQRLYGDAHARVAVTMNNLGRVVHTSGDLPRAEWLLRRALEIDQAVRGPDHPGVAIVMGNLGSVLQDKGEAAEAEQIFRGALAIEKKQFGADHIRTLVARARLGGALVGRGQTQQAAAMLAEVVDAAKRTLPSNHRYIGVFLLEYGQCLLKQDRFDEAEAALLDAHRILARGYGESHRRTRQARDRLVQLYQATGRAAAAEEWRSAAPPAVADTSSQ